VGEFIYGHFHDAVGKKSSTICSVGPLAETVPPVGPLLPIPPSNPATVRTQATKTAEPYISLSSRGEKAGQNREKAAISRVENRDCDRLETLPAHAPLPFCLGRYSSLGSHLGQANVFRLAFRWFYSRVTLGLGGNQCRPENPSRESFLHSTRAVDPTELTS
jgi:hypothetical protein